MCVHLSLFHPQPSFRLLGGAIYFAEYTVLNKDVDWRAHQFTVLHPPPTPARKLYESKMADQKYIWAMSPVQASFGIKQGSWLTSRNMQDSLWCGPVDQAQHSGSKSPKSSTTILDCCGADTHWFPCSGHAVPWGSGEWGCRIAKISFYFSPCLIVVAFALVVLGHRWLFSHHFSQFLTSLAVFCPFCSFLVFLAPLLTLLTLFWPFGYFLVVWAPF